MAPSCWMQAVGSNMELSLTCIMTDLNTVYDETSFEVIFSKRNGPFFFISQTRSYLISINESMAFSTEKEHEVYLALSSISVG